MIVKDVGLYILYSDGRIFHKKTHRFAPMGCNGDGYPMVCMNGKQDKVHRIIAKHFLPPEPDKPCVNHKNGIKTDNRVENLEWCTQGDNVRHAFKHGLMVRQKGSKNHQSKLKEEQVVEIKQSLRNGQSMTSLSKTYNISLQTIFKIKKGDVWKHVI